MDESFLNGRVILKPGDCRDGIKSIPDNSIDAIVTDPPYALVSIGKRFGKDGAYARASAGFMGKQWDTGETAFAVEFWDECFRVLKPGGHVVAFSGTRTYHRLAVAIEDAGFEIRDQLAWVYSTGFPKSHNLDRKRGVLICGCEQEKQCGVHIMQHPNVSKAVDPREGGRKVLQQGAQEQSSPIAGRTEPSASEVREGQPCLEGRRYDAKPQGELRAGEVHSCASVGRTDGEEGRLHNGAQVGDGEVVRVSTNENGSRSSPGPQPTEQLAWELGTVAGQQKPQNDRAWEDCTRCGKPVLPKGLGTALKPAWECIALARKPLIGTIVENVLAHGTGAINIDGCRVAIDETEIVQDDGQRVTTTAHEGYLRPGASMFNTGKAAKRSGPSNSQGRFPANLIHDGSDEVVAAFPGEGDKSASRFFYQSTFSEEDLQWRHAIALRADHHSLRADQAIGSVLEAVAARVTPELALTNIDYQEPSMIVMPTELKALADMLTEMTLNIERRFSQGLPHTRLSQSDSLVECVAIQEQTDTMKITISLLRSNGFAELVTFNIIATNLEAGALVSSQMARFWYSAKASKHDRAGSKHPTVKPVALMQWLIRLVCPKGGTVIDPFSGSGTTGTAAYLEGVNAILCEREEEYLSDIRSRLNALDTTDKKSDPDLFD